MKEREREKERENDKKVKLKANKNENFVMKIKRVFFRSLGRYQLQPLW